MKSILFKTLFILLPILSYGQATLIDKSQISASGASTNQILKWNGTAWVFANDENSGSISGTGTSGQIAFWNGTTSLTGSNNLFWDITNNRLGIGTTTPSYQLSTTGDIQVNGHRIGMGGGSISTNTVVSSNPHNNLTGGFNVIFGNSNSPNITSASGSVLIGSGAGASLTSGNSNTYIGRDAGGSNQTATTNFGLGTFSLFNHTTGNNNIGLGFDAGRRIVAGTNMTSSSEGIMIGNDTRPSANANSNYIIIGHSGEGLGSNTTTIGTTNTTQTWLGGSLTLGTRAAPSARLNVVGSDNSTSTNNILFESLNGTDLLKITNAGAITVAAPANPGTDTDKFMVLNSSNEINQRTGDQVLQDIGGVSPSGNVATATALQNSKTLWGQTFNGTANVTGALTNVGNISAVSGTYTHVSPILAAMAGEGFADMGMIGAFYDRNELTNAAYRGSVTVSITGAGIYNNSAEQNNIIVDGTGDFIVPYNLADTSIVTITCDVGALVSNYSSALWQPFVQTRLSTLNSETYPQSVVVQVSADNINWYAPASGWSTTTFKSSTNKGLWMASRAAPSIPGNRWRYARFIFSNFEIGALNYFYIAEIGVRHFAAPAARQFLNQVGGNTIYGNQIINGNETINGNQATNGRLTAGNTFFDANVTARISGLSNTNSTYALWVTNSDGGTSTAIAPAFVVRNDGNVGIGVKNPEYTFDVNGFSRFSDNMYLASNKSFNSLGNSMTFRSNLAGGSAYILNIQSLNNLTGSNVEQGVLELGATYAPTSLSGTPSFNGIKVYPTINQTGTANGVTRAIYINPTLTLAPNWRSIEWTNITGYGLYGSGTAPNYLNGALGIGTTSPASTSILDITSTTKGILIPRMTLTQRDAITSPATGLQIYNTDSNVFQYYNGTSWTNVGGTGVTDLTFSGSSSPVTLNSSTGADVTFVAGTNVSLSQSSNQLTINSSEVDGSISNEGTLGVAAGAANTSVITSNTSGAAGVTIQASTGLSISETTSSNGGTIVLTNSSPDQTVSLTGAGISSVTGTYPNFTITSTEVDGSTSNELQTLSTASNTVTLSNSGGSFTIAGAGINTVGTVGSTITVTGTEVDGSTTNEIQNLSLSGQSLGISSGTGVTLPVVGITAGTGISTSSTSGNFTITNTAPNVTTNLSFNGEASPVILNSSDGTDVTFVAGTNVTLNQTGNVLTINSTAMANPMTTLGDIIYGGASGAPTRLAGNTIAQRKFLTQTGTGSVSAAPEWYYFDETAFVYSLGRLGGQLVYGGTGASDYLALEGTSNASKGPVYLNYYGGDIRLGSGGAAPNLLKFFETNTSGTDLNFVAFKAPTVLGANTTYTLPTSDGSSNQVLTTNGSGVLSWSTPSTGISGATGRLPYYKTSTSLDTTGMYWSVGNKAIGINFSNPAATLQVKGTSNSASTYSLYVTSNDGSKTLNFDNSGKVGINVAFPSTTLSFNGSMSRKAPVKTGISSTYTVLETDSWVICNGTSNITLTLPAATDFRGREIMVKNVSAISVSSASSNIIAIDSNPGATPTTTTSILPATAGKWATLVSTEAQNGNWYWVIMQSN